MAENTQEEFIAVEQSAPAKSEQISPQMAGCKTEDSFDHRNIVERVAEGVLAIHICCANSQLPGIDPQNKS